SLLPNLKAVDPYSQPHCIAALHRYQVIKPDNFVSYREPFSCVLIKKIEILVLERKVHLDSRLVDPRHNGASHQQHVAVANTHACFVAEIFDNRHGSWNA